MLFNIILFPDFETLDVFGPVEVFGKTDNCKLMYFSMNGGLINNKDGINIETKRIDKINTDEPYILFIPGGMGTRIEIENISFIEKIKELASKASYVLSVCTGSALLARTGILDGKKATSNKRSFDWVRSSSEKVIWVKEARWVVDGKFYTSSGISAGIDMSLGFISDVLGKEKAEEIAFRIEYNWQQDKNLDNFCIS